jgi:hypothetical protein
MDTDPIQSGPARLRARIEDKHASALISRTSKNHTLGHALVDFGMIISIRIVHVCDDFVVVIVLLLVIDRSEHEHDYDQEHEGSIGCGCGGMNFQGYWAKGRKVLEVDRAKVARRNDILDCSSWGRTRT